MQESVAVLFEFVRLDHGETDVLEHRQFGHLKQMHAIVPERHGIGSVQHGQWRKQQDAQRCESGFSRRQLSLVCWIVFPVAAEDFERIGGCWVDTF